MSNVTITNETAILIVSCAAAINQQLYTLIDLLNKQIRVLKRIIGKRPRPTDSERRRLAAIAHQLQRRILEAQELIVTVDTFRLWYRQLIAATYTAKSRGRPRISKDTELLVVRMATDNPHWGEDSIRDRLANLGIAISDQSISNILLRHGIPPSPERMKTNNWRRFLEAHWPNLAAIDFATFEVPTENGRTQRNHVLYAIKPSTREVRLIRVTDHADGQWMLNMTRGITDPDTGFLHGTTAVLMDRDPLFTTQVRDCLAAVGSMPRVLPSHSPNLNAYIERFIGTVRREISQHIIPLSSDHLHHLLREHIAYYNRERNHQSLPDHGIPIPLSDQDQAKGGAVTCRSRLGKTLNYYHRSAA